MTRLQKNYENITISTNINYDQDNVSLMLHSKANIQLIDDENNL